MTAPKTYICGVCKGTFEGSPKGGFNTRSGEVVCCSGECTTKGLTTVTTCSYVSSAERPGRRTVRDTVTS